MRYRIFFPDATFYEPDIQFSEDYAPEIIRDFDNRILRERSNARLRLYGDAYNYFCQKINIDFCQKVEVVLQRETIGGLWVYENTFVIDLSGAKIQRQSGDGRYIEAELLDNTFQSILLNRWEQKAYLDNNKSLNCVDIDQPNVWGVWMFDPADRTQIGIRKAFRVYEVVDYLVQFMFDGEISLRSTFLNNLNLVITSGLAIRDSSVDAPDIQVSFKGLFDELSKIYNLWIGVEDGYLIIEQESYFLQETLGYEFDCVTEFDSQVDVRRLYSNVKTGSQKVVSPADDDASYNNEKRYYTHKEEDYPLSGDCQSNNSLDLVNEYVIDTNAIEFALTSGEGTYDEDLFFIECILLEEESGASIYLGVAQEFASYTGKDPALSGASAYYNEGLMNFSKINNWLGEISPAEISQSGLYVCTDTEDNITGTIVGTASFYWIWKVAYDEVLALNDWTYYSSGANLGIAVCNKTDYYNIKVFFTTSADNSVDDNMDLGLMVWIYDDLASVPGTAPAIVSTIYQDFAKYQNGETYEYVADFGRHLIEDGNAVIIAANLTGASMDFDVTMYSSCLQIFNCNEFTARYEASKQPLVVEHKFNATIDKLDFEDIRDNSRNKLVVKDGDLGIDAWIQSLRRNDKTGEVFATLIGRNLVCSYERPDLPGDIADLCFAYSVRVVVPGYVGPLLRLRRSSDDDTRDFYADANGEMSVDSLNEGGVDFQTWAGVSDVYVHTWYDPKGLYDVTQADTAKQPQFFISGGSNNKAFVYYDGIDDELVHESSGIIFQGVNTGGVFSVSRSEDIDTDNFVFFELDNEVSGVFANWFQAGYDTSFTSQNINIRKGGVFNQTSYNTITDKNEWNQLGYVKTDNDLILWRDTIEVPATVLSGNDKWMADVEAVNIRLGSRFSASVYYEGYTSEILGFCVTLNEAQVQLINNNIYDFYFTSQPGVCGIGCMQIGTTNIVG